MRHRKKTIKLGRKTSHREAMMANMVCSLIQEKRITTTLPKARAIKPLAEKMVTLGKRGDLHARRLAISRLKSQKSVHELFASIAPACSERPGGYTRIVKLGTRPSDASEMAIIEWVDVIEAPAEAAAE